MNNLEKAQKLKKYLYRKINSSGKNSCCIQFGKEQAKELLEEIKKGCKETLIWISIPHDKWENCGFIKKVEGKEDKIILCPDCRKAIEILEEIKWIKKEI